MQQQDLITQTVFHLNLSICSEMAEIYGFDTTTQYGWKIQGGALESQKTHPSWWDLQISMELQGNDAGSIEVKHTPPRCLAKLYPSKDVTIIAEKPRLAAKKQVP